MASSLTRRPVLGVVMTLSAGVLFAANGTVSKIAMGAGLSALQLVALRCSGAAVLFIALTAATRPRALRVSARELVFLAVYGVTGIALVQWLYFVAIARLPVGIALLLEYTAPVLVALWARYVRREPVSRRVWAALALCLAGLALVARVWAGATLDGLGVAAGFAAAVALASYYLLGEHGVSRRDPLSLSAWTFVFATLLWAAIEPPWQIPAALLASPTALPGPLAGTVVPLWWLAALVVLAGTVAPFLLIFGALAHLGATRTGLIGMAEPIGAGIVAWIVLGEVLAGVQVAGALLVLVGITLAETSRRRGARDDQAAPLPEGVAP